MQNIFHQLRAEMTSAFPERQSVIDGCLMALLASESILLLGPPGTAKSSLARGLARFFGGTYFESLLNRFSVPEDLFGPISLSALERDEFTRVTFGKLPTAQIAFLDEIFKASPSILNARLSILNERIYFNGGTATPCPLVTMFGASNETQTESREVDALYDRFLLRFEISYVVQTSSFRSS